MATAVLFFSVFESVQFSPPDLSGNMTPVHLQWMSMYSGCTYMGKYYADNQAEIVGLRVSRC